MKFKEGDLISCTIDGTFVKEAKIHREYCGYGYHWFICQNLKKGVGCKNRLGYKFSWISVDDNQVWVGITNIKLLKEVKMDKAKFGIKYDRDEDPVEFFETRKEADKRIKELLGEDDVDRESIYLFEVGNKWKVDQPVKYDLVEVK